MIMNNSLKSITIVVIISLISLMVLIVACPQNNIPEEDIKMIKNDILVENPKIPYIPPELSSIPSLPFAVDQAKLNLEQERYGIDCYQHDSLASIKDKNLILSATSEKPSWAIYSIDKVDQKKPITLSTWKVKATGGPYYVGLSSYSKGGWTIMGPFSIWNIGAFIPTERYSGPDGVTFLLVISAGSKTVVEGLEITSKSNAVNQTIKPIQRSIAWNQIDGYFEDNINDTWTREPISLIDYTSSNSKPIGDVEVRYQINQYNNYLFFAIEWPDRILNDSLTQDKEMNFDATSIYLCPGDRTRPSENDDVRTLSPAYRSTYLDQHFDKNDNTADDISMDGLGWCTYNPDSKVHQSEFVIPMVGDGKQDLNLNPLKPGEILVQMQFINSFHLADSKNAAMQVGYLRAGESKTTTGWLRVKPEPFNNPVEYSRFKGNLVFISDELQKKGELYKLEMPSGKITQLTNNDLYEDNVSISPDGTWCAFSVAKSNTDVKSFEIARINLDGSGYKVLTENDQLDGHPAISPDGKTIAFARYNRENAADIFLIPSNGGTARQLTDSELDVNDPDWFPDGKRLIVKSHDPKVVDKFDVIQILNVADGKFIERITDEKAKANDHDPIISPNGNQVAFMRFMEQKDWNKNMLEAPWQIFYSPLKETNIQQVTDFLGINSLPVWANDNELLFIRAIGPGYKQLWLTTKNGLQQNELIHSLPRLRYFDYKPTK